MKAHMGLCQALYREVKLNTLYPNAETLEETRTVLKRAVAYHRENEVYKKTRKMIIITCNR